MGSGLVLAGLAFLLVPSVGIIDLMPDFIGYALILGGISKLTALNGDIERARVKFRFLFYVTLLRAFMIIPLGMIGDEMTTMLFVFSFAVAETVFLLLAQGGLIEGVSHVASRGGCNIPDSAYNDIRVVFPIFIIGRAVLVSIPELTVLTNPAYKDVIDVTDLDKPSLYDSKNLVLLICLILSLFIGIVFYVSAVRFFSAPIRDKSLKETVEKQYKAAIEANPLKFVCSNIKTAILFLAAGNAFLCPLYFYGVDVLFDFVGFIFICIGFSILSKYEPQAKTALKLSVAAAALSALSGALSVYISSAYYHKTYPLTAGAVRIYTVSALLQTAEYILYTIILLMLFRTVRGCVDRFVKAPVFDEAEYKREFCTKYTVLCAVGAGLCPVMSLLGFLYMYEEDVWIAGLLIFAGYTVYMIKTLLSLPSEIERALETVTAGTSD